ncbi:NUDIX domain-containing protein [Saccharopolyspora cebuensis]|uniref:NUDIX domain-containing protein n=1 Tax=Saccharopolyspora cebuensis TaxID=418759 RepID=A0ABV4CP26_9PSEU
MADLSDERRAYLAEGNATQARKRTSADALVLDAERRVLLVNPTYKEGWDLPGGMLEANESPRLGLARELREELGLDLAVGRLLVVDWQAPHDPWDDLVAFVFDCGTLSTDQAVRVDGDEVSEHRWATPSEAAHLLSPAKQHQLERALTASIEGTCSYTER